MKIGPQLLSKKELQKIKEAFNKLLELQAKGGNVTSNIKPIKKFVEVEQIYGREFSKEEFRTIIKLLDLYFVLDPSKTADINIYNIVSKLNINWNRRFGEEIL